MTNQPAEQTVTFSDTETSEPSTTQNIEIDLGVLSFAEYCKRNPSASECKEYDI